jgi:hypothetical protein
MSQPLIAKPHCRGEVLVTLAGSVPRRGGVLARTRSPHYQGRRLTQVTSGSYLPYFL